jgi:phage gp45-like
MRHSNSRDSANRHGNTLSRTTLESTDDSPLMQQVVARLFHSEQGQALEHFHQYGFTARPKKPTGTGLLRQAAEAIFAHLGGNRSHGIALMVGDRRYRPNNLQEGEVVLHDDQGNQVYISRGTIVINAASGMAVHVQTADGANLLLNASKAKMQFGSQSVTCTGGKTFLGKEGVNHGVVTVDGPSNKVFAAIDEDDGTMQADATAKRTQAQGGGS